MLLFLVLVLGFSGICFLAATIYEVAWKMVIGALDGIYWLYRKVKR